MSESPRSPEVQAPPPSPAPERADPAGSTTASELAMRAREQAEAEAAVGDVMRREDEKAAKREAREHQVHRPPPLKGLLLLTLLLLNLYVWLGNPEWLRFRQPELPSIDYYEASWKMAVYLQRQRIEEYRHEKGHIPASAQQAGQPVTGVRYTPIEQKDYQLAAGAGEKQVVYHSTDSLSVVMGHTLLQMGLIAGGLR